MQPIQKFVRSTWLLLFSSLLCTCGSSEEPTVLELTEIQITSSNGLLLDLFEEETSDLSVEGRDQFGNPFEIEEPISWTKANDNINLEASGTIRALAVGTTLVTASAGDISGQITIEVWDSSAPRIDLYVSDVGVNRNGPHQIIRYNEQGGNPEAFITSNLNRPQDIVFLEDQGMVLISNLGSDNIAKFNLETGAFVGIFASSLGAPTRIDIGPDGLLYAIPWNGGFVKRYDLDGTFIDDFTSVSINESIGMAWDADDNLCVSSFNNGTGGFIRKFDPEGNDLGIFVNTNLSGPTDIWFDAEGNLFVNDWSANQIVEFTPEGAFTGVFASNVANPEGVSVLDDGSILIGASGSSAIKHFGSNGTFIEDVVPGGRGNLVTPNAVVIRKVNH